MRAVRAVADAILALALAPPCAACRRPLDAPSRGPVCGACWSAIIPILPPACRGCGDPLATWRADISGGWCPRCRGAARHITRCRAIGAYDGALRSIVHALKYGGRRSVARPLAALLARAGAEVLDGADFVVPVPLHRSRRRRRGFNQAEDLARHLRVPVARAVARRRRTPSQTGLPAAERRTNVAGAFRLARRACVGGAIVVLIDDVRTTGATLEACAGVLLEGGAREVRALTAARVVTTAR